MNYLKPAAGGLIGGLIGAAIWAAVAYFTHREVGWIAWGVGGLVGLGVRIGAGPSDGAPFGMIAAGLAALAIVLGKFAAVALVVSDFNVDAAAAVTEQGMIAGIADDVVRERQAKGKKVNFPPGMTVDKAGKKEDYPADVWQDAAKRWAALGPAEQQKQMAGRRQALEQLVGGLKGEARQQGFKESFGPFDLLWFGLAMLTAFRLGSGAVSGD